MCSDVIGQEEKACTGETGGVFRCLYDKDWTLTEVSNGFYQLLEYEREEVRERFEHKFLWIVDPRDRDKMAGAFRERLESGREIGVEIRLLCSSGVKWVWISGGLWPEDRTQFICMVYDQTNQRKALEILEVQKQEIARVREEAMQDSLTRTYNRAATERLVRLYIEGGRGPAAFMVADIDNFKGINDTLGHFYGDAVLGELAFELKQLLDGRGFVGRLGGDEFVIFIEDITCLEEAVEWADKAGDVLKRAFSQSLASYEVTGSIGIALYPSDGTTFRELLMKADDAMYYAKNHGKNQYAIYDERVARERRELPARERPVRGDINGAKSFRDHIVEYVFRIFYENKSSQKAIPVLLDLVGKIFDVSRVYILEISEDRSQVLNTFEWCSEGTPSCRAGKDSWRSEELIPFIDTYDNQGIYECVDSRRLPCGCASRWFLERGAISVLQCRVDHEERLAAIIGLEDCSRARISRPEARETLILLAQTISLFLLRDRQQEKLEREIAKQRELESELKRYRDV